MESSACAISYTRRRFLATAHGTMHGALRTNAERSKVLHSQPPRTSLWKARAPSCRVLALTGGGREAYLAAE